MITPRIKKGISVALVVTCLVTAFVFLIATTSKKNKFYALPIFKAVLKDSFRPLPLYGSNSINTRGPSWNDEAFRDSAASIGFKIVRYPGGGFGDFWDWRKGWFIDQGEATTKNMALPTQYVQMKYSATGLNELKLLTDKVNSNVLFELNMITRDVNDQVEMLKHAQEMGFSIKWIELGNEFNLPKNIGRTKFGSAQKYGDECNRWAKVIKQTFPNVKIGVVGGNFKYSTDVEDWNRTVLNAARNVDAIVAHIYALPKDILDDKGVNFENMYNAFKSTYTAQGFDDIKGKEIWFTEYNIHWAFTKIPGRDHNAVLKNAFTWGQALATVLMTSEITTLPGYPSLIINTSLANWRGFASVEERNGQVYMLPNGIGFRAWCQAAANSTKMGKISFNAPNNNTAKDFEITGWDFRDNNGDTYFMANFTDSPTTIDISSLNSAGKINYKVMYADKNKLINDWHDVVQETKDIKDGRIILPPYSIVII